MMTMMNPLLWSLAAQSAKCCEGALNSREVVAYKISIGLMLGLVFGIMGIIVFLIVRLMRREGQRLKEFEERRRREAEAALR
jgi:large-conductance mechanosensitive channel